MISGPWSVSSRPSVVTAVILRGAAVVFKAAFLPGVLHFFEATGFVTPLFFPLLLAGMVALEEF